MDPKDGETSVIPAPDTDETQKENAALPVVEAEADEELVNEAYKKMEAVFVEKMNAVMEEVGGYLIKAFFDGDTDRAREKNPVKEKSFTLLIEKLNEKHPSFGRKSWLYNAINVAIDMKLFKEAEMPEYEKLGITHKVYLTHVKNLDTKKDIARDAAEQGLTTRELADRIDQDKQKRERLAVEDMDTPESREKLKKKSLKVLKKMTDSIKEKIEKLKTEKESEAKELNRRYSEKIEAYEASEDVLSEILEEKEKVAKTKKKQKVKKNS